MFCRRRPRLSGTSKHRYMCIRICLYTLFVLLLLLLRAFWTINTDKANVQVIWRLGGVGIDERAGLWISVLLLFFLVICHVLFIFFVDFAFILIFLALEGNDVYLSLYLSLSLSLSLPLSLYIIYLSRSLYQSRYLSFSLLRFLFLVLFLFIFILIVVVLFLFIFIVLSSVFKFIFIFLLVCLFIFLFVVIFIFLFILYLPLYHSSVLSLSL